MVEEVSTEEQCSSCARLKQELESTKRGQTSTLKMIKEKIISTDKLIKKYQKKCDDFERQGRLMTELANKYEECKRNALDVQKQLDHALEVTEPQKKTITRLLQEKFANEERIMELKKQNRELEGTISSLQSSLQGKEDLEIEWKKDKRAQENKLEKEKERVAKLQAQLRKVAEEKQSEAVALRRKTREHSTSLKTKEKLQAEITRLREQIKYLKFKNSKSQNINTTNQEPSDVSENARVLRSGRRLKATATKQSTRSPQNDEPSSLSTATGVVEIFDEIQGLDIPVLSPLPLEHHLEESSSSESDDEDEQSVSDSLSDLGDALEMELENQDNDDVTVVDHDKEQSNTQENKDAIVATKDEMIETLTDGDDDDEQIETRKNIKKSNKTSRRMRKGASSSVKNLQANKDVSVPTKEEMIETLTDDDNEQIETRKDIEKSNKTSRRMRKGASSSVKNLQGNKDASVPNKEETMETLTDDEDEQIETRKDIEKSNKTSRRMRKGASSSVKNLQGNKDGSAANKEEMIETLTDDDNEQIETRKDIEKSNKTSRRMRKGASSSVKNLQGNKNGNAPNKEEMIETLTNDDDEEIETRKDIEKSNKTSRRMRKGASSSVKNLQANKDGNAPNKEETMETLTDDDGDGNSLDQQIKISEVMKLSDTTPCGRQVVYDIDSIVNNRQGSKYVNLPCSKETMERLTDDDGDNSVDQQINTSEDVKTTEERPCLLSKDERLETSSVDDARTLYHQTQTGDSIKSDGNTTNINIVEKGATLNSKSSHSVNSNSLKQHFDKIDNVTAEQTKITRTSVGNISSETLITDSGRHLATKNFDPAIDCPHNSGENISIQLSDVDASAQCPSTSKADVTRQHDRHNRNVKNVQGDRLSKTRNVKNVQVSVIEGKEFLELPLSETSLHSNDTSTNDDSDKEQSVESTCKAIALQMYDESLIDKKNNEARTINENIPTNNVLDDAQCSHSCNTMQCNQQENDLQREKNSPITKAFGTCSKLVNKDRSDKDYATRKKRKTPQKNDILLMQSRQDTEMCDEKDELTLSIDADDDTRLVNDETDDLKSFVDANDDTRLVNDDTDGKRSSINANDDTRLVNDDTDAKRSSIDANDDTRLVNDDTDAKRSSIDVNDDTRLVNDDTDAKRSSIDANDDTRLVNDDTDAKRSSIDASDDTRLVNDDTDAKRSSIDANDDTRLVNDDTDAKRSSIDVNDDTRLVNDDTDIMRSSVDANDDTRLVNNDTDDMRSSVDANDDTRLVNDDTDIMRSSVDVNDDTRLVNDNTDDMRSSVDATDDTVLLDGEIYVTRNNEKLDTNHNDVRTIKEIISTPSIGRSFQCTKDSSVEQNMQTGNGDSVTNLGKSVNHDHQSFLDKGAASFLKEIEQSERTTSDHNNRERAEKSSSKYCERKTCFSKEENVIKFPDAVGEGKRRIAHRPVLRTRESVEKISSESSERKTRSSKEENLNEPRHAVGEVKRRIAHRPVLRSRESVEKTLSESNESKTCSIKDENLNELRQADVHVRKRIAYRPLLRPGESLKKTSPKVDADRSITSSKEKNLNDCHQDIGPIRRRIAHRPVIRPEKCRIRFRSSTANKKDEKECKEQQNDSSRSDGNVNTQEPTKVGVDSNVQLHEKRKNYVQQCPHSTAKRKKEEHVSDFPDDVKTDKCLTNNNSLSQQESKIVLPDANDLRKEKGNNTVCENDLNNVGVSAEDHSLETLSSTTLDVNRDSHFEIKEPTIKNDEIEVVVAVLPEVNVQEVSSDLSLKVQELDGRFDDCEIKETLQHLYDGNVDNSTITTLESNNNDDRLPHSISQCTSGVDAQSVQKRQIKQSHPVNKHSTRKSTCLSATTKPSLSLKSNDNTTSTQQTSSSSTLGSSPSIADILSDSFGVFSGITPILDPLPPSPTPTRPCSSDCSRNFFSSQNLFSPITSCRNNEEEELPTGTAQVHLDPKTQDKKSENVKKCTAPKKKKRKRKKKEKKKVDQFLSTRPALLPELQYTTRALKHLYANALHMNEIIEGLSIKDNLSNMTTFAAALMIFQNEEDFLPIIIQYYGERNRVQTTHQSKGNHDMSTDSHEQMKTDQLTSDCGESLDNKPTHSQHQSLLDQQGLANDIHVEQSTDESTCLISSFEQRVMELLKKLEQLDHLKGVSSLVITYLSKAILLSFAKPSKQGPDKRSIASYCRMMCCLCRQEGDLTRVRTLCYDIMRHLHGQPGTALYLLTSIAAVWPAVLSYTSQSWILTPDGLHFCKNNSQPLLSTINVVVMHLVRVMNWVMLGNIINWLCAWKQVNPGIVSLNELFKGLVKLMKDPTFAQLIADKDGYPVLGYGLYEVIKSIELIACAQGWSWLNNVLIRNVIWDVLSTWANQTTISPKLEKKDTALDKQMSSTCNEQSISNKEEAERESPVLNNDQTSTVCEPTAVATIRLLGLVCRLAIQQQQNIIPHVVPMLLGLLTVSDTKATFAVQLATAYSLLEVSPWQPQEIAAALMSWKEEQLTKRSLPESLLQGLEILLKSITNTKHVCR